ncbi:MAG: FkbM family methyltransferase [Thermodesulfobacteriota bacterium]
MPANWGKDLAREAFRWYLSKFPLRDGKAYFYEFWHSRLMPAARYVTARLDPGFIMKLDLNDPEQRKIYFYGHYHERYEARLIRQVLAAQDTFWDIGAHIGYFTLLAAQALHPQGKVAAFEPAKEAYARLEDNIALNPFNNVSAYNLAVSQKEGEARLYLTGDIADSSANLFNPKDDQTREEVVRTVALDQFSREQPWARPDFLKIDVEGAELAVLQGAEKTLRDFLPLLLIEMEEKNLRAVGLSKEAIQDFLRHFGYQAAFLHKGRWYATQEVSRAPGRNLFWYHPDLASHRDKAARVPIQPD